LDAEILAEVFLSMTGGQSSLLEDVEINGQKAPDTVQSENLANNRPALRVILCSEQELVEHQKTLEMIKNSNGLCLWTQ
jgi:DNA polymerase-3 subunit epsilon